VEVQVDRIWIEFKRHHPRSKQRFQLRREGHTAFLLGQVERLLTKPIDAPVDRTTIEEVP
jgi:hypothetical protein